MDDSVTDVENLRGQWMALANNPLEAFKMLPIEALVASIRDLAEELLERTKPAEQESNFVKHARRELELIGEEPETIEAYLRVLEAFSGMNHSGGSASVAIPVVNDLLRFKPLSPLTDDPEDWLHHTEEVWGEPGGIWQCRRYGEAFSNDGGKTYYLLSEGGNDKHREPLHTSVDHTNLSWINQDEEVIPTLIAVDPEPEYTFCGPTGDPLQCACGCNGEYEERCPLYLKHYHGTTQVPASHICCKIPGRE
jgi:hypothetical protein